MENPSDIAKLYSRPSLFESLEYLHQITADLRLVKSTVPILQNMIQQVKGGQIIGLDLSQLAQEVDGSHLEASELETLLQRAMEREDTVQTTLDELVSTYVQSVNTYKSQIAELEEQNRLMKVSELELRGKLCRKEVKWQHVKHKLDQEVQEGHLQLENCQKALNEEIAHMNENLTEERRMKSKMAMWFRRRLDALEYHVAELQRNPEKQRFEHLLKKINRLKDKKPWKMDQNLKDVHKILEALNHTEAHKKTDNSSSGTCTPFSHYSGIASIEAASSENETVNQAFVFSMSKSQAIDRSQSQGGLSLLNQTAHKEGSEWDGLKQRLSDPAVSITEKERLICDKFYEQHPSLTNAEVRHVEMQDLLNATKCSHPDNSLSLDLKKGNEVLEKQSDRFNAKLRLDELKEPNFIKSFSAMLSPIVKEDANGSARSKRVTPLHKKSESRFLEDLGVTHQERQDTSHMLDQAMQMLGSGRCSLEPEDRSLIDKVFSEDIRNEKQTKATDVKRKRFDEGERLNEKATEKRASASFSRLLTNMDDISMIDRQRDSIVQDKRGKAFSGVDDSLFDNDQIKDLLVSLSNRDLNSVASAKKEDLQTQRLGQVRAQDVEQEVSSVVDKEDGVMYNESENVLRSEESMKSLLRVINHESNVIENSKLDTSVGSLRRSIPKLDLSKIHESKKLNAVNLAENKAGPNKDTSAYQSEAMLFKDNLDSEDEAETGNKKTEKPSYPKLSYQPAAKINATPDDKASSQLAKTPVKLHRGNPQPSSSVTEHTAKKSRSAHKSMDSSYSPVPQQTAFQRHAQHQFNNSGGRSQVHSSAHSYFLFPQDNGKPSINAAQFTQLNQQHNLSALRPPAMVRKKYQKLDSSTPADRPLSSQKISFEHSKSSVYRAELVRKKPHLPPEEGGIHPYIRTKMSRGNSTQDNNHMPQARNRTSYSHNQSFHASKPSESTNYYYAKSFHYSGDDRIDFRLEDNSRDTSLASHTEKFNATNLSTPGRLQKHRQGITTSPMRPIRSDLMPSSSREACSNGSNTNPNVSILNIHGQNNNLHFHFPGSHTQDMTRTRQKDVSISEPSSYNITHIQPNSNADYYRQGVEGTPTEDTTPSVSLPHSGAKGSMLPYKETHEGDSSMSRRKAVHDISHESSNRIEHNLEHREGDYYMKEKRSRSRGSAMTKLSKLVSEGRYSSTRERDELTKSSIGQSMLNRSALNRSNQTKSPFTKPYSPLQPDINALKAQSIVNTSPFVTSASPEKGVLQTNFRSKRFKDVKKA